jgi:hypothetical protein
MFFRHTDTYYKTTQHHNREYQHWYLHCRERLKPQIWRHFDGWRIHSVLDVVYALETSVRRSMESGLEWKLVDGFLVWIYVCSIKMSRTVPPSHEVWSGASYCRQRPEVETLTCMYVCMYACMYLYVPVYIYICMLCVWRQNRVDLFFSLRSTKVVNSGWGMLK